VLIVFPIFRWREFVIRAIYNPSKHGLQIRASGLQIRASGVNYFFILESPFLPLPENSNK
jgi:hypothetical protein